VEVVGGLGVPVGRERMRCEIATASLVATTTNNYLPSQIFDVWLSMVRGSEDLNLEINMSMWHCHDRLSGDRFEVHGENEDGVVAAVRAYVRDGLDEDSGVVDYDVVATAIDGSEYTCSGTTACRGYCGTV
jgi:hypothetical protein